MLTDQDYIEAAKELGCDVPAIQAVDEVESSGGGMVGAKPKILFEPHIFWKELRKVGVTPTVSDICYPVWGTKPYPKGQSAQWLRMEKAVTIHREAALKSASYGRYQIMGFNHKLAGFSTLQAFVNAMYQGDKAHLKAFVKYVKAVFLDDELKAMDWAGFARGYNGPAYHKNKYDKKLKDAYMRHLQN